MAPVDVFKFPVQRYLVSPRPPTRRAVEVEQVEGRPESLANRILAHPHARRSAATNSSTTARESLGDYQLLRGTLVGLVTWVEHHRVQHGD